MDGKIEEFTRKVKEFYKTPAREIMVKTFPKINAEESIKTVIGEISNTNIDHFWIEENGKIVGIVTEKDLLNATKKPWFGESASAEAILKTRSLLYRDLRNVTDLMTRRLFKINQDTELETIVKLMVDNHIRHLPVFDGEDMVGEIVVDQIIKQVDNKFFD